MSRFTADDARQIGRADLDRRIRDAVANGSGNSASLRVYHEDPFRHRIKQELEERGFINVDAPDVGFLKWDVHFEWEPEAAIRLVGEPDG